MLFKPSFLGMIFLFLTATLTFGEMSGMSQSAARFSKLSDFVYILEGGGDRFHVGAVVTDEGVLLINPPAEGELSAVQEALRRVTSRPVRWLATTDSHREQSAHQAPWIRQGAASIQSRDRIKDDPRPSVAAPTGPPDPAEVRLTPWERARVDPNQLRLAFAREVRLFPSGLEVRIMSMGKRGHLPGDVVVLIASERILFTGDLFVPAAYPEIESSQNPRAALDWIDGMKELIASVPLLKSAMPQPRSETAVQEEEKTLEETFVVVPARGRRSNLQEMKDAVDLAERLRRETERAIRAGRTRENLLSSSFFGSLRNHRNFDSYALLLFDALSSR